MSQPNYESFLNSEKSLENLSTLQGDTFINYNNLTSKNNLTVSPK